MRGHFKTLVMVLFSLLFLATAALAGREGRYEDVHQAGAVRFNGGVLVMEFTAMGARYDGTRSEAGLIPVYAGIEETMTPSVLTIISDRLTVQTRDSASSAP